jgi:S-DNA-T family DNA segregation ATPase FtsK/SpoIIIE
MSEQQEHVPGSGLEVRSAVDAERMVFDAEIVGDEQRPPGRRMVRGTVDVVRRGGPVATTGGVVLRGTARGAWVAGQGGVSWARRTGAAITHGHLREQIRLARIAGDREALADWTERLEKAKDARAKRLLELPRMVLGVFAATGLAVAALWLLILAAGITVWASPGGLTWTDWWYGVGVALDVLFTAAKVAAALVAAGAGPLVLLLAFREGKRVGNPPVWLLTPLERARAADEPITPSKVVTALRDLGISTLRSAIKEMGDSGAAMLSPIRIAGRGVEVDIVLPSGVSTDEIQKRRRKLAENLDRHEYELFISVVAARTVRLWIADSGALDDPIGPSPLVIDQDMTADLYTGAAPWGEDLRGDAVALPLKQRHLLVTGLSNQGKTAAVRALALWVALDTSVEFRIADLKGIGDWSMFEGLATVLIEGPTDEHVIAATEMLEEGVREMERRMAALDKKKYPNGVTRELARKPGSGFHPIKLIVDEAQVAFMCPAVDEHKRPYGGQKATSRYFLAARKLHNQGRAVNVILWQGTQDPTNQNLPKLVREGAHIRASLALGTEEQARMALGDKAIDGGAAPHLLRQGHAGRDR